MSNLRHRQESTVLLMHEPHVHGNVSSEIEEFMPGVRRYFENIRGEQLPADTVERFRQLFSAWNTFLQPVQETPDPSAIVSSNINKDLDNFIFLSDRRGDQYSEDNKGWLKLWLPRWDMFLRARAGETLVTWRNFGFTIVGFLFYIADMGSDIVTAMYYFRHGQWWQAALTLALVYAGVFFYTGWKWIDGQMRFTSLAEWLRYIAASLVNWPDLKLYGALCLIEHQLYKSPASSARLVPEWHQRRVRVAFLKYTEGVWEACPQAILQLCLLVPDLYGHWTWTDYLRIAGASISLCTAGAALVNREKCRRIFNYADVPLRELAVLHVWAVPVTVSRLLSLTLLVRVHLYWALAGVALHLVLRATYWCIIYRIPRTLGNVIDICLYTLQFFVSPFFVTAPVTSRRAFHAVHLLLNTAVTVVWALGTPLVFAQPGLYTVIIYFNAAMFAVGLVGWQVHENYWPSIYKHHNG